MGPEPTVERRGRIVVGRMGRRLVAAKQRESVLVFGPPGSGKTSAFAIPNVLEWDEFRRLKNTLITLGFG